MSSEDQPNISGSQSQIPDATRREVNPAQQPQVGSNMPANQNHVPYGPSQQVFQPAPRYGAYAPNQQPADTPNPPAQPPQNPLDGTSAPKQRWWLRKITLKVWQLILTVLGSAVVGFIVILLIVGMAMDSTTHTTANTANSGSSPKTSQSDSSDSKQKPDPKKLESISADYDGDTTPGTKIDDTNTGIKVTASYSDGSTLDVDGWTVDNPGELQDGKTSTFTIKYKNQATDLEITASQSEESYKGSAQDLSYDDLARNPDSHKGQVVHFKGKIIQVIDDDTLTQYRISVTPTSYGSWDNPVYVTFKTDSNNRFLEDDVVEFWGTSVGTITYESTMGGNITIPAVMAEYMQLSQ